MLTAEEAELMCVEMRAIGSRMHADYLVLGHKIEKFKKGKGYRALGFDTLKACMEVRCQISERMGRVIASFTRTAERLEGVPEDEAPPAERLTLGAGAAAEGVYASEGEEAWKDTLQRAAEKAHERGPEVKITPEDIKAAVSKPKPASVADSEKFHNVYEDDNRNTVPPCLHPVWHTRDCLRGLARGLDRLMAPHRALEDKPGLSPTLDINKIIGWISGIKVAEENAMPSLVCQKCNGTGLMATMVEDIKDPCDECPESRGFRYACEC